MSTYRVVLDGQDIYDPTKKDLVLYNAVVKTEAGAAGSFDFTMPPGHVFYGKVTPYGSTIEVFEDGESIFYGRPLRPKIGFYNQATYHCEGALAFLNDIHGPEFIYEDIMVQNYFRNLIATHNAGELAKPERRFTVGNITVIDNVAVYRETSPSSTIFDLIKKGCIGTSGGYLFTRRVNGVTYIDWVADMPYTCNQTVEFAVNLIDMARSGDDDIYTGVMLKGGKPDDAPEGAGAVTAGPIWMSAEIQAKYGNMCAYLEYPDIQTSAGLIEKGDEFLQKQQFVSMCFEVTAAEQHYLNVSLDAFRAGQMVYLISNPHFVQMQLPVQSVEYNLNSGVKKVALGTSKRQTLTKIERRNKDNLDTVRNDMDSFENDVDEINNDIDRIDNGLTDLADTVGSIEANQGVVSGDDGYDYGLGVDTEGNVYATKIPKYVMIADYKAVYRIPDTYSGQLNKVYAFYSTDPDAEGEDVTSSCSFYIRYWEDGKQKESPASGFRFTSVTDTITLVAKYTLNGYTREGIAGISAIEPLPKYIYAWGEVFVPFSTIKDSHDIPDKFLQIGWDTSVPYNLHYYSTGTDPEQYLIVSDYAPPYVYYRSGYYMGFINANYEAIDIPATKHSLSGSTDVTSRVRMTRVPIYAGTNTGNARVPSA